MSKAIEKSVLILEHEKKLADILALQVLDRPQLSVWMILIPIIFVYYFYQYQKFTNDRKMFAEHYLISRKHALDEAVEVINTGRKPDTIKLAKLSDVPDDALEQQAEMLAVLVEHYATLLGSDGEDFESLVRSAYSSRSGYLLFLNHLNQAEKAVNKVLKPHLKKSFEGIDDTVSNIESWSEKLRREEAENIFS